MQTPDLLTRLVATIGQRIDAQPVLDLIVLHMLVPVYEDDLKFLESEQGISLTYENQVVVGANVSRHFAGEIVAGVTTSSGRAQVRAALGDPEEHMMPDTIVRSGQTIHRAGWDRYRRGDVVVHFQYHPEGGMRLVSVQRP